jgi:hypothetical protein
MCQGCYELVVFSQDSLDFTECGLSIHPFNNTLVALELFAQDTICLAREVRVKDAIQG